MGQEDGLQVGAGAEGDVVGGAAVQDDGGARGEGAWTERPDYPRMASVEAAADMWSKTDLTPADVDIAAKLAE